MTQTDLAVFLRNCGKHETSSELLALTVLLSDTS